MGIHCTIPPTFAYEIFHNEKLRKKDLMTKPYTDHYKNFKKILKQYILDEQRNY